MNGIETLKKRVDSLQPIAHSGELSEGTIAARAMSDEEIEQRVKTILAAHPDESLDDDLLRRARHISRTRQART